MTLLFTMLPLYLLGNLHCAGMCGPLVMMLGMHRHRYAYFIGRMLSYTLAGLVAGSMGTVFNLLLHRYHLSAIASFILGLSFLILGFLYLTGLQMPGQKWLYQLFAPINKRLSILMLQDKALPIFLFGFFTLALPCGQTLLVFAACALSGDALTGALNGFAFALLTSPSLFISMSAIKIFKNIKTMYNQILGIVSILAGLLMVFRGLADMEIIPHLILSEYYHIIIY